MIFRETKLKGAYVIEVQKIADARGFFGRSWCTKEFEAQGMPVSMMQANIAVSFRKGTLRGLHYQEKPFAEAKLIRCTRGAAYDVIVDLREDSPTCGQWFGTDLAEDDYRMVYAPEGFAHGYLTIRDNTEMTYSVSQFYTPRAERGIRYDDPALMIRWPAEIQVISDKDRAWPDYVVQKAYIETGVAAEGKRNTK